MVEIQLILLCDQLLLDFLLSPFAIDLIDHVKPIFNRSEGFLCLVYLVLGFQGGLSPAFFLRLWDWLFLWRIRLFDVRGDYFCVFIWFEINRIRRLVNRGWIGLYVILNDLVDEV